MVGGQQRIGGHCRAATPAARYGKWNRIQAIHGPSLVTKVGWIIPRLIRVRKIGYMTNVVRLDSSARGTRLVMTGLVLCAAVMFAACGGGGIATPQTGASAGGGSCSPAPCASGSGVSIYVLAPHDDPANNAFDFGLRVDNQSSGAYTIVPGTDITVIGANSDSVFYAGNGASGANCYDELSNVDFTVEPGHNTKLSTEFCITISSSFGKASQVQIEGNTPTTYTINL